MKFRPFFFATLFAGSTGCSFAASQTPVVDRDMHETLRAMSDASTWGHPDQFGQFAGMQRYAKGKFESALKYFKIGARYADKLSQLSIGLMHLNGQGVPEDHVLAYAWTAVAAERGYPQFVATRDRIWTSLSPAQQVQAKAAEAGISAEYGDRVAKPRMTRELNYWRTQMTGSLIGFNSGVKHMDKAMWEGGGTPNPNCGHRTISNASIAGCGGDVYAKSRWDPKIYYKTMDSNWMGTVTVGALQQTDSSATQSGRGTQRDSSDSGN